jgi:hypothetical protein
MRWLLYGALTPAVGEALRAREDQAVDPAGLGLAPDARPGEVLRAAHRAQVDILTSDAALANAPFAEEGGWAFGRSIVFLQLAGGDVEQDDALDRLFQRYKRLTPGRLYTVTETRVKIRQLPARR